MIKVWYGCFKAEIGRGINADLASHIAHHDALLATMGREHRLRLIKLERSNAQTASAGDAAGAFLAERNH